jgi:hypothetical protein
MGLLLLGAVACSSPSASPSPSGAALAWPDGEPLHLGVVFTMPFSREPYDDPSFTDAILISENVRYVGPEGTTVGQGVLTSIEVKVQTSALTCAEDEYANQLGHDLADPPGQLTADLAGGISILMIPEHQVVAYGEDGLPECWEHWGTYTASVPGEGSTRERSGQYHAVLGTIDLE